MEKKTAKYLKLDEKTSLADLIGTPCKAGERYYEGRTGGPNTAKADVETAFADGFPTFCEIAAEVAQLRFEMELIRQNHPNTFPAKVNFRAH